MFCQVGVIFTFKGAPSLLERDIAANLYCGICSPVTAGATRLNYHRSWFIMLSNIAELLESYSLASVSLVIIVAFSFSLLIPTHYNNLYLYTWSRIADSDIIISTICYSFKY